MSSRKDTGQKPGDKEDGPLQAREQNRRNKSPDAGVHQNTEGERAEAGGKFSFGEEKAA